MRIFSKGKKDTSPASRSFSVGNVEKKSSGSGTAQAMPNGGSPKKPYINNAGANDEDDMNFLKPPPSLGGAITEQKRSSSITNMLRILSGGNNNSGRTTASSDATTNNSNSPVDHTGFHKTVNLDTHSISPELVPIVTLLAAQAHRRYHVGVFLLFHDLTNDGTPAERVWNEQYAVLIGNQLALWNSKDLEQKNLKVDQKKTHQELAHDLFNVASKPKYLNFTDAKFRLLEGKENTLVISTTMKNRYFLKFADANSFKIWHSALRLCAFEYSSLQEAYTGAFLSSKGAKLSDIKVILADSKFNYEDWVSVRFGAGMPWKRCYAVVTPGKTTSKKSGKKVFGEVVFYENSKKINNKKYAMASITSAFTVFAIYPSSPLLIDDSTMLKIEGEIEFNDGEKKTKKSKHSSSENKKEGDIFIMPEKHNGVPGYDTIIRFLVPILNSFHLYGRPERLISARDDLSSLLYGLPTLPEIHYLQVSDLFPLTTNSSSGNWDAKQWKDEIKQLMLTKLRKGYSGCGSASGYSGALMTGSITTGELFGNTNSPKMQPIARFVSGSESPQRQFQSPQRLTSNPLQNSIPPNKGSVNVDNGLGLSIKAPISINTTGGFTSNADEPKTPTTETPGMNIPNFGSSQTYTRASPAVQHGSKKPDDISKSPYHQYKQSSLTPEKKVLTKDNNMITANPVSVGKVSGANADAFIAAAPVSKDTEGTFADKESKNNAKKQSSQNARASVSSNVSIIDSYAGNGFNNTFAKPTSGLGIVSSNNATPKKIDAVEEEEDDYVVKTTDDPLADFYKLSRTLSNFNTLDKALSKQASNQSSERPANKQLHSQSTIQSATNAAKKYVDEGIPDVFNSYDDLGRSKDDIFYDAPQHQPNGVNIKKSPQLQNISSFVSNSDAEPPTIMGSPNIRKHSGDDRKNKVVGTSKQPTQPMNSYQPQPQNIYHQNQQPTQIPVSTNHYSPKQPQVNTNPYYRQQQQALHTNGYVHGKPKPPVQQGYPGYPQAKMHSPVGAPQQIGLPQNFNRNGKPQPQFPPNNMNHNGNNMYMQHQAPPQRPYMQQRNSSNGSFNSAPANKKIPVSQQYKGNAGGFAQFMPASQNSNPYKN